MAIEKFTTQRLFGRTSIDSLNLHQNAWYIDEEQVTATAAELNAAADGITTINAYNATGGSFTVGMLLHVSSFDTTSGYLKVEKADADASKPAQYVAIDTTGSTKTTTIQDYYDAVTFNTVGATVGDPVYLSITAGAFSLSAPTGADDVVQIVGRVKTVDASGKVIIDLRKEEKVKIGTNEYVDASVTAAKLATDVGTTLAGAVASTGLTAAANVLSINPNAQGATIGTDSVLNMTAGGAIGKTAMSNYVTAMAGNGLAATTGVLSLDLNELTGTLVDVAADSLPFIDSSGTNATVKTTFSNLATAMAGEGLTSTSGQINLYDKGQSSHGGVFFGGVGDCTAIVVGAVTYTAAGAADLPNGVWKKGDTAANDAASLAAAINGDTRAPLVYSAEAIGAGVVIRAITPGTAGNVTVSRTGGAQPATTQNLVQGRSGKTCQVGAVYHTVTTFDALLTEFTLELPFSPDVFIVQVRTSAGVIRNDLTDTFNFDATPAGVVVTKTGITNVAAGDIITVLAISL